jgi:tRNA(Ile2) C34 agmatinyltransferase TiaS
MKKMMKAYFGFDDTDTRDSIHGTGKLVRWFLKELPRGCECMGVVRQQLYVCNEIPYTSHNSAACMIIQIADSELLEYVIECAVNHLEKHFIIGSDPGLCVATEFDQSLNGLVDFGHMCTHAVTSQKQAIKAARSVHLSGHGGTNEGIIGAAAAVGLTASGWSGRFIEYKNVRDYPETIKVFELRKNGIQVVSMDRDANAPAPDDLVFTNNWLRPRLLGHRPILFVHPVDEGRWENIYSKRTKRHREIQRYSEKTLKS